MTPRASDEMVVWMSAVLRHMIGLFAATLAGLWTTITVVFLLAGHGVGNLADLAPRLALPTTEGTLIWFGLGALGRRASRRLAAVSIEDRP